MTRYRPRTRIHEATSALVDPDRPVEVHLNRADGFSDLDLLALLLGGGRSQADIGAAQRVLALGSLEDLLQIDPESWDTLVRPGQAVRLGAALEFARRVCSPSSGFSPEVSAPQDVFALTADLRARRREHVVGLYLNTRHRLLARETISVGSLNASIVHPREVFEPALRLGAAGLVVVHNHPSGETDPSDDDLNITRRLAEAGEILGIELLDHIIVGSGGYTSLKERAIL